MMIFAALRMSIQNWRDRRRKPCAQCADGLKVYGEYLDHIISLSGVAAVIQHEIHCPNCRRIIVPAPYDADRMISAALQAAIERAVKRAIEERQPRPRERHQMKAVEFEGQSIILCPPEGWDNSEESALKCGGLPVQCLDYGNGYIVMRSFWRPSDADVEALKNGAHICVGVVGAQHPPIQVYIERCEERP